MGTIINAVAIFIGGGLGLLFRKRLPERISQTTLQVLGLFTMVIGLNMAIQSKELILVLISLVAGAILGEWINIEDRLERFGKWLEKSLHVTEGSPAKGFIYASLLFCVGSMAIVGSITDGIKGGTFYPGDKGDDGRYHLHSLCGQHGVWCLGLRTACPALPGRDHPSCLETSVLLYVCDGQ